MEDMKNSKNTKSSTLGSALKLMIVFAIAIAALILVSFVVMRFVIRGSAVEVPDIVGKSFLEATQILNKSHLGTPIIDGEKYNASMPDGYIVEQKPKPGTRVKKGREIKVFVSKGTEAGIVPNVTGEMIVDAQPALQSLGLEIGSITKVHTEDFPQEGIIIAHTPPPQAKVQKGTRVNLLVSLGRPIVTYTMPDLAGMYMDEALEIIKQRGLKSGLVEKEFSPDVTEPGIVLDQKPQPGERIKRGAIVNLVVSSMANN
jgi:beta-lactam-binding protein with PASTA domain